MPTLIRLVIALLFVAGLGLAAMYALTVFVDPGEKEVTVRIPARDLAGQPTARLPEAATTSNPSLPASAPVPVTTSAPSTSEAPLVEPGAPE